MSYFQETRARILLSKTNAC